MTGEVPADTELPAAPSGAAQPGGWDSSLSSSAHNVDESQSLPSSPTPDTDSRRNSLPVNFQIWSGNTSGASLAELNHGETSIDETIAAQRTSALRQLNGAPNRGRRRQRQSRPVTGSTTLSSQPVIVRTYSGGGSRPHSHSRATPSRIREEGEMNDKVDLPPVEAFTFQAVFKAIEHDVEGTLNAIAEICAKSRYSLADEYGAHRSPLGDAGRIAARGKDATGTDRPPGSTLTAVEEASSSSERLGGKQDMLTVGAIVEKVEVVESIARSSLSGNIPKFSKRDGYDSSEASPLTMPLAEGRAQSSDAIDSAASSLGPPRWRHSTTVRSKSSSWISVPSNVISSNDSASPSQDLKSPIDLISGLGCTSHHRTATLPASEIPSISTDINAPSFVVEPATVPSELRPMGEQFSGLEGAAIEHQSSALPKGSGRKASLLGGYSAWLFRNMKDDSSQSSQRGSSIDPARKPSAEVKLRDILQGTSTKYARSNGSDKGKDQERVDQGPN